VSRHVYTGTGRETNFSAGMIGQRVRWLGAKRSGVAVGGQVERDAFATENSLGREGSGHLLRGRGRVGNAQGGPRGPSSARGLHPQVGLCPHENGGALRISPNGKLGLRPMAAGECDRPGESAV